MTPVTKVQKETANAQTDEQVKFDPKTVVVHQKKVDIIQKYWSVREYYMMYNEHELELQPFYQRNYVMDLPKASRIIESILMGIPIPEVYLAEEDGGKYSVIDGQQRLTSIITFMAGIRNNKVFKLSGLKVLTYLNGKTFTKLSSEMQSKIKTTTIPAHVVLKSAPAHTKFTIFERLNSGSIKLNVDEVRNMVYRGTFMNLIKELDDNKYLNQIINHPKSKQRFMYRGFILRFFALSERTYLNYKPSMKKFCNDFLETVKDSSPDRIQYFKKRFYYSIEMCSTVFGQYAFRKYLIEDKKYKTTGGVWAKAKVNQAIYDLQMLGFANYTRQQIIPNADIIREAFVDLILNDEDFISSIEISTSGKDQLQSRCKKWLEILDSIITKSYKSTRAFPRELIWKKYQEDNTCYICEQKILFFEDAAGDHIKPFTGQGGSSDESNCGLTHRICNLLKSQKSADQIKSEMGTKK